MNTAQEEVLAPERTEVPRGGREWAAQALLPAPPKDGPFLDIGSVQTDFMVRLGRERRPRGWLFERRGRQCPAAEATEKAAPVDPEATRTSAGRWMPWLCEMGAHLRCVSTAPGPQPERREVHAELEALSLAGVSLRLISEKSAARAIVPDVLLAGRKRAYALVYDNGLIVGATVIDDVELVGRWRDALSRLHARGVALERDVR